MDVCVECAGDVTRGVGDPTSGAASAAPPAGTARHIEVLDHRGLFRAGHEGDPDWEVSTGDCVRIVTSFTAQGCRQILRSMSMTG